MRFSEEVTSNMKPKKEVGVSYVKAKSILSFREQAYV